MPSVKSQTSKHRTTRNKNVPGLTHIYSYIGYQSPSLKQK